MPDQNKIVIADDHSIVRQGLRQMIDADAKFAVVGEAKNGKEALDLIEANQPDVAVLDIDMPEMGGFELVRELRRRKIKIEIVFLTMHWEEEIFQTAMDLNVGGYVLKDDATIDIVAAVKSVAAGKSFISPALSYLLLNRCRRAEELKSDKPALATLTPTERRVLHLIAEDKTSKEIGDELFISHDSSQMRGMMRRYLPADAEEILECGDGIDALACYEKFLPDWVLMDWQMKQMNGLETTRQIIGKFPEAKILIVTQYNDIELREAATEAGACGFVLKKIWLNCDGFSPHRLRRFWSSRTIKFKNK